VPAAIRQAIGTIILPAWRELVLEADGMARSLGMTMVHMMWLELLSQADLSRDYTQVTAVLKLPVDFSGILDQHVKLVNLKLKVAAFLLRLKQHRRKHGPGGRDLDPWADYARQRRAEVDQPDRWESLSPDDDSEERFPKAGTQQPSSRAGPQTPPFHAPPSPDGDLEERFPNAGTQQSSSRAGPPTPPFHAPPSPDGEPNEPFPQSGTQQPAGAGRLDRTDAPSDDEAASFPHHACEQEDVRTAGFRDQLPPREEDTDESVPAAEPGCSDE
jgi:hypothetical protein